MTTRLVDTGGWVTPVDGPANTELVTGDSVCTPLEACLSRERFLYELVGPGGTGSKRWPTVAGITDMQALTGMADADIVFVAATGPYRFVAASAASSDSPWVIVPTAGSGRWHHTLVGLAGGSEGLATVLGGRVVQRSSGALVKQDAFEGNDIGHLVVNGYEDVVGATLTFSAAAGDRVHVDAQAFIQGTASGIATLQIVITDTSSSYTTTLGESLGVGATQTSVPLMSFKTGLAAGTVTVKLQLKNANPGVGDARITYYQLRYRQSRP